MIRPRGLAALAPARLRRAPGRCGGRIGGSGPRPPWGAAAAGRGPGPRGRSAARHGGGLADLFGPLPVPPPRALRGASSVCGAPCPPPARAPPAAPLRRRPPGPVPGLRLRRSRSGAASGCPGCGPVVRLGCRAGSPPVGQAAAAPRRPPLRRGRVRRPGGFAQPGRCGPRRGGLRAALRAAAGPPAGVGGPWAPPGGPLPPPRRAGPPLPCPAAPGPGPSARLRRAGARALASSLPGGGWSGPPGRPGSSRRPRVGGCCPGSVERPSRGLKAPSARRRVAPGGCGGDPCDQTPARGLTAGGLLW